MLAKFKLLILLAVSPILSCQAQNSFGQDDLANADAVVARLQRGSTEQEKAFEANNDPCERE